MGGWMMAIVAVIIPTIAIIHPSTHPTIHLSPYIHPSITTIYPSKYLLHHWIAVLGQSMNLRAVYSEAERPTRRQHPIHQDEHLSEALLQDLHPNLYNAVGAMDGCMDK
jgi:hypothetical protein